MKKWAETELQVLRDRYQNELTSVLASELGRPKTQLYAMAKKLGLQKSEEFHKGPLSGRKKKGELLTWTEEQHQILRERYPHEKTSSIAADLGRTVIQVYGRAKTLGIKRTEAFLSGSDGGRLQKGSRIGEATRYKKGNVSWIKGKKIGGHPNSVPTQFRKGQQPHNTLPIGTELVIGGYLRKKMTETGYRNGDWVFVHRLLWEEHNGPVPDGHVVIFKDGNKSNITIENLECISRGELSRRNIFHNRYPEELKRAIWLRGALVRKINRIEKEKKP